MSYPPMPAEYPTQAPEPKPSNGFGLTALILGIVSLIACIPAIGLFAFILAPLAIIFGFIGLKKARTTDSGKGMSLTGIILGFLGLLIAILWTLVFIFGWNSLQETCEDNPTDTELIQLCDGLDPWFK